MKNGLRVYDSDTHINPVAEILDKYVDPDFRPRLPELARYRSPSGQAADGKSDLHNFLGQTHGRAGGLRGRHCAVEDEAKYMMSGRFFCSIEHHEGEDMLEIVSRFLGDDVLMYASDYPHSECQFPDSVSNILAWSSLTGERQRKLLWENANRFFRST